MSFPRPHLSRDQFPYFSIAYTESAKKRNSARMTITGFENKLASP
jgi:hypothetical protein